MAAATPALTFTTSRGHIRVDSNDQPALICADLGTHLNIWQTIGLNLTPTQARTLAGMLNEWADNA